MSERDDNFNRERYHRRERQPWLEVSNQSAVRAIYIRRAARNRRVRASENGEG